MEGARDSGLGGLGGLGVGDGSSVVSATHFSTMGTCHAEVEEAEKYVLHSE